MGKGDRKRRKNGFPKGFSDRRKSVKGMSWKREDCPQKVHIERLSKQEFSSFITKERKTGIFLIGNTEKHVPNMILRPRKYEPDTIDTLAHGDTDEGETYRFLHLNKTSGRFLLKLFLSFLSFLQNCSTHHKKSTCLKTLAVRVPLSLTSRAK